jgi:archaemetzincin
VSGDNLYPEVEEWLLPLATELPRPGPGDWLAEHPEPGQTFEEYLAANPVRRSDRLHTLYLCLLGEFNHKQEEVLYRTREYLGVFFDVPVRVRRHLALSSIPPRARRIHPDWGNDQILSTYVLRRVLAPDCPDDALAYLALTATYRAGESRT